MNKMGKVTLLMTTAMLSGGLIMPTHVALASSDSNDSTLPVKSGTSYVQESENIETESISAESEPKDTTVFISNEQILNGLTAQGYNIHDIYSQKTLDELYAEDMMRSGSNWDHIKGNYRTVGMSSKVFNTKKNLSISVVAAIISSATGQPAATWMVKEMISHPTDIKRGVWIHYKRVTLHRNNGFAYKVWNITKWGYQ
ncbi:hypothetical protein [Levilactobacillus spicheri]|uniref:Uncharacterized protein n=1 Tax=Levilactobacillus spicheri TaxID=216463 RepID=A0A0F3RUK1_9LACO|nr:hypothetical protein [Levilactobacillus spicheri]KJW13676.1 hypothetical protein VC81_01925 [Levilactobacillus spicheri]